MPGSQSLNGTEPFFMGFFGLLQCGPDRTEVFFFSAQGFHAGLVHGMFGGGTLLPRAPFFLQGFQLGLQAGFFLFQAGIGFRFLSHILGRRGGLPATSGPLAGGDFAGLDRGIQRQRLSLVTLKHRCCGAAVGSGLLGGIKQGSQRAKGKPVSIAQSVAENALSVDESSGGGAGIKKLYAAVGISYELGVVL
jgi:hypothetical protein